MSKLKELSKDQKKSIRSLFIDRVSVPMLILATTVLFSAVSLYGAPYSILEIVTLVFAAAAIPLLGVYIFFIDAMRIFDPKIKYKSSAVEYVEAVGFTFSFISFICFLSTVLFWLGFVAVFFGFVAFLIHVKYLREVRSK